ncbi:hypothetical protein [Pseudoxanthomonas sp. CF125]|uniref:hypothetical protein n=1 Tax=Pseudoxanthomonas sp. CF125 TaxID=1855303 RepID=UPI0008922C67|nr:hypothetical protein [Pseudoxanthomonas sp. CF125]SDR10669.1 hypothetical protein SAMN05216569_3124 [Pseudoxanthomonas sp. CF125]
MNQPLPQLAQDNYLRSRHAFREIARNKFLENPHALPLVSVANEYVATTMFLMSGKDVRSIPHGIYIAKLIVSFVRTHFIAVDLTIHSELVEAATLTRKQIELLARLNELRKVESVEGLLRRTPNLSSLQTQIKSLYGSYSEIAHSSALQPLELLGSVNAQDGSMTAVYPMFTEHAYTSLGHIAFSVLEYFLWADKFFAENFSDYDADWASGWIRRAVRAYETFSPESSTYD